MIFHNVFKIFHLRKGSQKIQWPLPMAPGGQWQMAFEVLDRMGKAKAAPNVNSVPADPLHELRGPWWAMG